jgi:hypothetical protein
MSSSLFGISLYVMRAIAPVLELLSNSSNRDGRTFAFSGARVHRICRPGDSGLSARALAG